MTRSKLEDMFEDIHLKERKENSKCKGVKFVLNPKQLKSHQNQKKALWLISFKRKNMFIQSNIFIQDR